MGKHDVVLAKHPTKSWWRKNNTWSQTNRRYYPGWVTFVYCPDCRKWGWENFPPAHSLCPKSELLWRGKVKV